MASEVIPPHAPEKTVTLTEKLQMIPPPPRAVPGCGGVICIFSVEKQHSSLWLCGWRPCGTKIQGGLLPTMHSGPNRSTVRAAILPIYSQQAPLRHPLYRNLALVRCRQYVPTTSQNRVFGPFGALMGLLVNAAAPNGSCSGGIKFCAAPAPKGCTARARRKTSTLGVGVIYVLYLVWTAVWQCIVTPCPVALVLGCEK